MSVNMFITNLHDVVNVDEILVVFRLPLDLFIELDSASRRHYELSVVLIEDDF